MTKTYKREVACVLLAYILGMFVWGAAADNAVATQAAEFLTLPCFTFAGAAFAMDAVFRQGGKGA